MISLVTDGPVSLFEITKDFRVKRNTYYETTIASTDPKYRAIRLISDEYIIDEKGKIIKILENESLGYYVVNWDGKGYHYIKPIEE